MDLPLGIMTVITGVAGSGKSTLISRVFAAQYEKQVIIVNQEPITAMSRSTPATFLGFFDSIRKLFAEANGVDEGMFSFNSKGACPCCQGKGVIVTELALCDEAGGIILYDHRAATVNVIRRRASANEAGKIFR